MFIYFIYQNISINRNIRHNVKDFIKRDPISGFQVRLETRTLLT